MSDFAVSPDATLRHRGPVLPVQGWVNHPLIADRASGSQVWDIAGRRYTDFILAFGSIILGHADPGVNAAVCEALSAGIAPTLHSRQQFALAEELTDALPGTDLACVFLRTGSDATSAAVRIARAETGRARVIRVGYNGWHDWAAPRSLGVPAAVQALTTVLPYNDSASLEEALTGERGEEVACAVVMPFETDLPTSGYLEQAATLARRSGAVLIFDEVRTGFRLALGGAQEYFHVNADIACYSKAMANGHSISAVVGPADLMKVVSRISMSSVFFRSADGFAAARKTIELLRTGETYKTIWQLGSRLMTGLARAAENAGVPATPIGLPPMPFHRFDYGDEAVNSNAALVFSSECVARGVLFHASHHWFLCGATSTDDVDNALAVAYDAYCAVARSVA